MNNCHLIGCVVKKVADKQDPTWLNFDWRDVNCEDEIRLHVGLLSCFMFWVRVREEQLIISLNVSVIFAPSGSDVVDWLHRNVDGFTDRREARKYAGNLLKAGYIRHTVNKVTFSEQCYYVFGDLCGGEHSQQQPSALQHQTHQYSLLVQVCEAAVQLTATRRRQIQLEAQRLHRLNRTSWVFYSWSGSFRSQGVNPVCVRLIKTAPVRISHMEVE